MPKPTRTIPLRRLMEVQSDMKKVKMMAMTGLFKVEADMPPTHAVWTATAKVTCHR